MHVDLRRLRPPDLVALFAGMLLVVSLFLPWYQFPAGSRDAFSALTVSELPAALAAVLAFALVAVTVTQRSPALPVALATFTTVVGFVSAAVILARTVALPASATGRCYGLWLALAGAVLVTGAAFLSLRDESPFWGVPAGG
jgi:hypothetical protein